VFGFRVSNVQVREADGRAVLRVERLAGRTGSVSVDYATQAWSPGVNAAAPGADFTPVQGRLTWADGDDSEREIVVPIVADPAGTESPELFDVVLSGTLGGGLALTRASVNIVGDAFPAGMFRIEARSQFAENEGSVLVIVQRQDYNQGEVSVLVGVTGGTAQEGSDYRLSAPVRLTWRDGDWDSKTAAIVLVNDATPESPETIELSLSDATGGALIGPTKSVTVTIADDDAPAGGGGNSGGGGGGGGNGGGLLALLAAAGAWLRRRRREL
jgi:MYXO-CTERM domain-containing protein